MFVLEEGRKVEARVEVLCSLPARRRRDRKRQRRRKKKGLEVKFGEDWPVSNNHDHHQLGQLIVMAAPG